MFGRWKAVKVLGRFSHFTLSQCMYKCHVYHLSHMTLGSIIFTSVFKSDPMGLFDCLSFVLLKQRHDDHLKGL